MIVAGEVAIADLADAENALAEAKQKVGEAERAYDDINQKLQNARDDKDRDKLRSQLDEAGIMLLVRRTRAHNLEYNAPLKRKVQSFREQEGALREDYLYFLEEDRKHCAPASGQENAGQSTKETQQKSEGSKTEKGCQSRIVATPKSVAVGGSAVAVYRVGECDQIRKAQIVIVADADQRTPLGRAEQGTDLASLGFRAPDKPGTYQLQIIGDSNRVLAADTLTVVRLITEIPLPAPNSLAFRHTNGRDVAWQGELTVKSFHVSTWVGTNYIYVGDATGDTPISTLSGRPAWAWGTGIQLSLRFSFDNGKIVDSGNIGGTRGPNVSIAIPEGAERLTGIEVQTPWTVFDYQTWKGSAPGSLKWSLDIPLAAMGMAAPDPKQR